MKYDYEELTTYETYKFCCDRKGLAPSGTGYIAFKKWVKDMLDALKLERDHEFGREAYNRWLSVQTRNIHE